MKLSMDLKQTQSLQLSASMYQSLEMLQLNAMDLVTYINDLALDNPFIEFIEESSFHVATASFSEEASTLEDTLQAHTYALTDILLLQSAAMKLPPNTERVVRFLIFNLTEAGYLAISIADAVKHLGVSEDVVLDALKRLQSMEPAGIGARDISECILLQAQRQNTCTPLFARVVNDHLLDIAAHKYARIAKQLKLSIEEVRTLSAQIRSFNPKPANGFEQAGSSVYVKPDVFISMKNDTCEALPNAEKMPQIKLSQECLALLAQTKDPAAKQYLQQQFKHANEAAKQISQRNSTILTVASAIAMAQARFFSGTVDTPEPLTMMDIAEWTQMNVSTVSRAANGTYLQCSKGIYPFKYFFPRVAANESGATEYTAQQIKDRLLGILETENSDSPWSDQQLSNMLSEQMGVPIARRTIAKYRAALNIPNTSGRRGFHKQHE